MGFAHPELLAPSLVALVACVYPAPWHLRTGNIATLSMIFWMACLNFVHIVGCIVWSDNADIKGSVWGDISCAITVGYNFGLPLSHLILAKQLEAYTSLRTSSVLYDQTSRRRHKLFDLIVAIAGPILGILLHLSVQDRRFYIVESYGPMPATYWSTWGVILMAIIPICIALGCAVYTVMALVNVYLRHQQMLSMIASDASVNKEQFYRLMFLTLAELGTCGIRAIFNLMSFQGGPQPLGQRGPPSQNLSIIEIVTLDQLSPRNQTVLGLQFFTVIACSYVFFLCFATSTETKRFYNTVLHRLMPCIPHSESSRGFKIHLDSSTGSTSTHRPLSFSGPATTADYSHGPKSPRNATTTFSDDKDISLEEMLGAPPLTKFSTATPGDRRPSQAQFSIKEYSEEALDGVHLPDYSRKGSKASTNSTASDLIKETGHDAV